MSSQIWLAISNGLKNLRLTTPLQSRFLEVQAAMNTPRKPKKPLSPYFRFMMKVRGDLAAQNPSLPAKDLIKLIGQKWSKLDTASKEHYGNAFQAEIGPYTEAMAKYNESLTPEIKEKQGQEKLEKQLKKEQRERRKRLESLGKPKKPATPFLHYVKANFPQGSGQGRDYAKDQLKLLSTQWKLISEAEKAPFVAKYEKDAAEYKKAITKWEDSMIKMGNKDVVRADSLPKKSRAAKV